MVLLIVLVTNMEASFDVGAAAFAMVVVVDGIVGAAFVVVAVVVDGNVAVERLLVVVIDVDDESLTPGDLQINGLFWSQ